jgi:acyl-coenzyme A synthetase/AMP-(fatty) acid ligase
VVGHDPGDGLIKPRAYVVVRAGYAADDRLAESIKHFVKSRLALYKYPRWVDFIESLPKNDRGKIDRKLLKQSSE